VFPFRRVETEPPAFSAAIAPLRTGRFAIASDFQRTSRAEVWRESNEEERAIILAAIAREDPELVLMLGDLVFCGSSASDWRDFEGGIDVEMRGLAKGERRFETMDRFRLPWPEP